MPLNQLGPEYPISVVIEKVDTGEIRTYEGKDWECIDKNCWDGPGPHFHDYIWREGNYSCDCNRALFFYAWGPESENVDCSDGKFRIVSITDKRDGKIVYQEGKPNE